MHDVIDVIYLYKNVPLDADASYDTRTKKDFFHDVG